MRIAIHYGALQRGSTEPDILNWIRWEEDPSQPFDNIQEALEYVEAQANTARAERPDWDLVEGDDFLLLSPPNGSTEHPLCWQWAEKRS